jgi:hypothetical protein
LQSIEFKMSRSTAKTAIHTLVESRRNVASATTLALEHTSQERQNEFAQTTQQASKVGSLSFRLGRVQRHPSVPFPLGLTSPQLFGTI